MTRRSTSTTHIGGLTIGSDSPILIQSMANTDTNDIATSVAQAKRIFDAGAQMVRFTTQGTREALSLGEIRRQLQADGYTLPLVADVHFNPKVADVAATLVEKVRVNPGNYVDPARKFLHLEYTDEQYAEELERLRSRFSELLTICRKNGTALRIGVNHGSLSDRIMSRYGDTPAGMAESCMEFLRVCKQEQFSDIVLSVKASNTRVMYDTVHLLVEAMDKEDMHYPLHLGVTEAGEGEDGRLKSAVGIGGLLNEGIGDTVRVSLSEAPEAEVPVAQEIVSWCSKSEREKPATLNIVNDKRLAESWGKSVPLLIYHSDEQCSWEQFMLHAAADCGAALWKADGKDLRIENPHFTEAQLTTLAKDILQAARVRIYKTEYISCPSCGRTLFDIEKTIAEVKAATKHLTGLKIAIMGCIVNGPGEMADADYGYVGAGRGRVSLYKGKECVLKNIPQEEAVEQLLRLIEADH